MSAEAQPGACFTRRSHGGELNPTLTRLDSVASPGVTAVLARRPLKPAHTQEFCSDGTPPKSPWHVKKPTSLHPSLPEWGFQDHKEQDLEVLSFIK